MKHMILTIVCAVFTSTSFAYYNSEQGRWLSRDPIQEDGGQNLYVIVRNSPTYYVDYLGLITIYIGGAGEGDGTPNWWQHGAGHDATAEMGIDNYFEWTQGDEAAAAIRSALESDPCQPVIIIGHSYGGDTSRDVVEGLSADGITGMNWITLDPVSVFHNHYRPEGVYEWINVHQPQSVFDTLVDVPVVGQAVQVLNLPLMPFSNQAVATGGNQWNAERNANRNISTTTDHNNVAGLLNVDIDGMSLSDYIAELRKKNCCEDSAE